MVRSPCEGREVTLLVNVHSRNGMIWFEQSQKQLAEARFRLVSAECFDNALDLFRRAREEAEKDRVLIVGGGDGTLSAVANIVARTNSVMGVLPAGTGNSFARDLGIQTEVKKAVEVLSTGRVVEVDLGMCDGQCFLNVVTIGLTTTIAQTLTVPLKRRFGRFVYGFALYRALKKRKRFRATITTEHGQTVLDTIELVIGNGRYHAGPLPLSLNASITSGTLQLYAVRSGTNAELLKYALLLPTGLQGILSTVHSESTVGGTVSTVPYQSVVVDGEVSHKTPLKFEVAPRALNVIVPWNFSG